MKLDEVKQIQLDQECTNRRGHVDVLILRKEAPNICGYSVYKLYHIALLAPII
jgi:hypothetical protein